MKMWSGITAVAGVLVLAAACQSSGAGGRELRITQTDEGCTPASASVTPGEKIKLVVKNESSKDYEVEGIEGTPLEEVVIPEGRTRTPGFTVPASAGVYKIKCYIPAGVTTIIELTADAEMTPQAQAPAPPTAQGASYAPADSIVKVALIDYAITPDATSLKAGVIRFDAMNDSTGHMHEMEVLRVKSNGSLQPLGEVAPLRPGERGSLTLTLAPGTYRLACFITKGQYGGTIDHYLAGMHADITVN
jgi:uncharacterized cupredoxin-like copper-binding protein